MCPRNVLYIMLIILYIYIHIGSKQVRCNSVNGFHFVLLCPGGTLKKEEQRRYRLMLYLPSHRQPRKPALIYVVVNSEETMVCVVIITLNLQHETCVGISS